MREQEIGKIKKISAKKMHSMAAFSLYKTHIKNMYLCKDEKKKLK
jgi:hypothetical protein